MKFNQQYFDNLKAFEDFLSRQPGLAPSGKLLLNQLTEIGNNTDKYSNAQVTLLPKISQELGKIAKTGAVEPHHVSNLEEFFLQIEPKNNESNLQFAVKAGLGFLGAVVSLGFCALVAVVALLLAIPTEGESLGMLAIIPDLLKVGITIAGWAMQSEPLPSEVLSANMTSQFKNKLNESKNASPPTLHSNSRPEEPKNTAPPTLAQEELDYNSRFQPN